MKKPCLLSFLLVFILNIYGLKAQITVSPAIFTANQAVTLTYDATQSQGQALANLPASVTSITAHIGAILTNATGTTWTNVPGTWGDPAAQPKFTRTGTTNIYTLVLPNGIRSMFGTPLTAPSTTPIFRVGIVLRENGACGGFGGATIACKEGKSNLGQDIFLNVNQGTFDVAISSSVPTNSFVNVGTSINIGANSNIAGDLVIKVNGTTVASQNGTTSLNHTLNTIAGTSNYIVEAVGTPTGGGAPITRTVTYLLRQNPSVQAIPTGMTVGINYNPNDASKATLVITAPEKKFIYVVGDFNNWQLNANYLMRQVPNYGGSGAGSNPANNKFWIELTGLTPGQEYRFQYWVYDLSENLVKVAETYADKILDPNNDQFIAPATYPNLIAYPSGQQGAVSVLETGQAPYQWSQATLNFQKPDKKRLNIYEVWVGDFDANRNFQDVINRLDYIQNLGINAVQFMPIMEFNGNISWGYNTTFFSAVDKTYGSKNKFKELIDKCHQRGIAVILDIALNHAEFEFPGCKMYWNSATNQPASNNPWFNVQATHPFSVFQDFNHESAYTREFAEKTIKYWIDEYKIDGYRYDLIKGLTQVNSGSNVGTWNNYDASRVTILKRIADWQWQADSKSYIIFEFLATGGVEEKEYADYRLNDGALGGNAQGGIMLWRNLEVNYAQNIMGFTTDNSLQGADFDQGSNPFQQPRVVSYMESHDEERVMFKALQFGNNSITTHNVRNLNVALKRVEPAILFQIPITGPKMIWQFGELGYDFSLGRCPDGTNQGANGPCRTDQKPLPWVAPQNYHQVTERNNLYKFYAAVNQLKLKYDVFMDTNVNLFEGDFSGRVKQLRIEPTPFNASPTDPNKANVIIVANFDVATQNIAVRFNHTGTWYSYFQNNATFNVTNINGPAFQSVTLGPGEYRLFTDVQMVNMTTTPTITANLLSANATVVSGVNVVSLSWGNTNVTSNATGIRIRRCVMPAGTPCETVTLQPNATSYNDPNIAENTTYSYTVEVFNANGITTSNTLQVTTPILPPIAPSNLVVSNVTANNATLQWTDNSSDEVGFRLQRKTGAAGVYADLGTSNLAANTASTNDATIASNNTYFYRVAALKGTGMSEVRAYSNEVQVSTDVPAAPSGLTLTAQTTGSSIVLNWTDNSNNETGFRVLRSLNGNIGSYVVVTTLTPNTTNYTDTGLNELTQYFYQVQSFNVFGDATSNANNATTLMMPPVAPSNLRLTNIGSNTATIEWTDNSNNELGFIVQRRTTVSSYADLGTITNANVVTFTDNTIAANTTYFYRVAAVRGTGVNEMRTYSSDLQISNTPPTAPSLTGLNDIVGTTVNIVWIDLSNNEDGFIIKRKASPTGTYTTIFTTAANITTYSDASAPVGSAYTYQICAFRGNIPASRIEACSNEQTTPTVLSLENNAFAQSITIYPNPANETIKVRLPQVLRMVTIEVKDVMGKSITTLQMPENDIETNFDVSKFAQGTYFLHFNTSKGNAVKKMIKR